MIDFSFSNLNKKFQLKINIKAYSNIISYLWFSHNCLALCLDIRKIRDNGLSWHDGVCIDFGYFLFIVQKYPIKVVVVFVTVFLI